MSEGPKERSHTFRGYASPDGNEVGLRIDADAPVSRAVPMDEAVTLDESTKQMEYALSDSAELRRSTPPVSSVAPALDNVRSPFAAPVLPGSPFAGHTPFVEIEIVHQHGSAPRTDELSHAIEVWTQNRVYTCTAAGVCIRVWDRATQMAVGGHSFLGFRLAGGQFRDGNHFELSFPYPRPGSEAVFEHTAGVRGHFSRTSAVSRVVLRIQVITVSPSHLVPTWSQVCRPLSPSE